MPTFTTSNERMLLLLADGASGMLRVEDAERLQVGTEALHAGSSAVCTALCRPEQAAHAALMLCTDCVPAPTLQPEHSLSTWPPQVSEAPACFLAAGLAGGLYPPLLAHPDTGRGRAPHCEARGRGRCRGQQALGPAGCAVLLPCCQPSCVGARHAARACLGVCSLQGESEPPRSSEPLSVPTLQAMR